LGPTSEWHAESHDGTIAKTTRGLYWHQYGEVLAPDANVKTYFFYRLDDDLFKLAMSLERRHIGGNERFVYAFGRAAESPAHSIWMYQFYRGHWAAAFTSPACAQEDEVAEAAA
jgi:hypothetical protein